MMTVFTIHGVEVTQVVTCSLLHIDLEYFLSVFTIIISTIMNREFISITCCYDEVHQDQMKINGFKGIPPDACLLWIPGSIVTIWFHFWLILFSLKQSLLL